MIATDKAQEEAKRALEAQQKKIPQEVEEVGVVEQREGEAGDELQDGGDGGFIEDLPCMVCGDTESPDDNQILLCDGCPEGAAHLDCTDLEELPGEDADVSYRVTFTLSTSIGCIR